MLTKVKPIDILYVEDDAMDVDLANTALTAVCNRSRYKMEVVDDGEKALQFLNKTGPFKDAITPDVILLDLNLPKIHGKEVLRTIKNTEHLKRIPVIVLTTSQAQHDVDESYDGGASGYLNKPMGLQEYNDTFKAICEFWFHKASLPTKYSSHNAN